jgi:hypothetical protein
MNALENRQPNRNLELHEQLALRRLKPPELRHWLRRALHAADWLASLLEAPELRQRVAPNQPPLRRHEWEKRDWPPPPFA